MLGKMAGPTGFEPATSRLTIWRPNQAERRPLESLFMAEDRNDKTTCGRRSSPELYPYMVSSPACVPTIDGRRNRDRTCDLCLVRAALSQLSYPPDFLSNLGGGYQVPAALSTGSRTLLAEIFLIRVWSWSHSGTQNHARARCRPDRRGKCC